MNTLGLPGYVPNSNIGGIGKGCNMVVTPPGTFWPPEMVEALKEGLACEKCARVAFGQLRANKRGLFMLRLSEWCTDESCVVRLALQASQSMKLPLFVVLITYAEILNHTTDDSTIFAPFLRFTPDDCWISSFSFSPQDMSNSVRTKISIFNSSPKRIIHTSDGLYVLMVDLGDSNNSYNYNDSINYCGPSDQNPVDYPEPTVNDRITIGFPEQGLSYRNTVDYPEPTINDQNTIDFPEQGINYRNTVDYPEPNVNDQSTIDYLERITNGQNTFDYPKPTINDQNSCDNVLTTPTCQAENIPFKEGSTMLEYSGSKSQSTTCDNMFATQIRQDTPTSLTFDQTQNNGNSYSIPSYDGNYYESTNNNEQPVSTKLDQQSLDELISSSFNLPTNVPENDSLDIDDILRELEANNEPNNDATAAHTNEHKQSTENVTDDESDNAIMKEYTDNEAYMHSQKAEQASNSNETIDDTWTTVIESTHIYDLPEANNISQFSLPTPAREPSEPTEVQNNTSTNHSNSSLISPPLEEVLKQIFPPDA